MELYALQPEIKAPPRPAEILIPLACAEELPLPVQVISIPKTVESPVLETPIQAICQSPLEQPVSVSKDQLRALIVDDNEINLKVSDFRENPIAVSRWFSCWCDTTNSPTDLTQNTQQILATFMRKLGHVYDTATNGLIALEMVQSSIQRYDLILMGEFPSSTSPY